MSLNSIEATLNYNKKVICGMAGRRKDMWTLLYSLVSRNDADLGDVFVCVDDILCKDPSLIRYSQSQASTLFQDTFILWLINKLNRSLGSNGNEFYLRNIKIQQKLLRSCLANHPVLFEQLVTAYIAAIDELATKSSAHSVHRKREDGDRRIDRLEVTAFSSDNVCLQEIDAEFRFENIQILIHHADIYVRAFLQILRYSLIGYDIFPALFEKSLLSIFKAIKECDMSTKLMCLQYVVGVFRAANKLSELLQKYYELTLRVLVLMWEQLPAWLCAECVQQYELEALVQQSAEILCVLKCFAKDSNCKGVVLQHSLNLLRYIDELSKWEKHNYKVPHMDAFLKSLIDYLVHLLEFSPQVKSSQWQDASVFLHLTEDYPFVVRLIASIITQTTGDVRMKFVRYINEKILEFLEKTNPSEKDYKRCEELLVSIRFLEHFHRKQYQLEFLATLPTPIVITQNDLYTKVDIYDTFFVNTLTPSLNMWVSGLIETQNSSEFSMDLIRVVGCLLQTTTMRRLLSLEMQSKLIDFLSNFLKGHITNAKQRQIAKVVLEVLCEVIMMEPTYVSDLVGKTMVNLGRALFSQPHTDENVDLYEQFSANLQFFVVVGCLSKEIIEKEFYKLAVNNSKLFAAILRVIYCIGPSQNVSVFGSYRDLFKTTVADSHGVKIDIFCGRCNNFGNSINEVLEFMKENSALLSFWRQLNLIHSTNHPKLVTLPPDLKHILHNRLLSDASISFIVNHLDSCDFTAKDCFRAIQRIKDISLIHLPTFRVVVTEFAGADLEFLHNTARYILRCTVNSLEPPQSERLQLQVLKLITCCTEGALSEQWLFHFFKMTFFFLVHPESKVVQEAVICASEMCVRQNVQPIQLWNWYKRDALCLIVKLATYVYLRKGVRLTRSLKAFIKMLGFSCVQEFICKYYRLLITMILPYCVKEPQCKGLIVSISKVTRKPIATLLEVSFLRIYTHICLTEGVDVSNKCIELIGKCTGSSLMTLMNADVKQTVSEFLIYFNRNPAFVMQAFQCLLPNEVTNSSVRRITSSTALRTPTNEFASFIADRFLGIITYFQTCLAEPNFEKPLKEECLFSLGQILRLVGTNHVTQFRFKIIAMLSFVISLEDQNLQNICLKLWNIFVHIVDTQEIGPSLNRIVASLQPLLRRNESEVNAIYEYLILENDSLLGAYIPDLYFVENMIGVRPAIRKCIARQTDVLRSDTHSLYEKLSFFYKQITNENLQVRIHGLVHMRDFIATHRKAINQMILGVIGVDPLIKNIVDTLIAGCRHEDCNMHLESAKCLGELGAIDPSYMPSNYCYQVNSEISLSIHTDDFAVMALTELCRAYQFQKDSKYVDNFSLAIQETLSVFGISPKENKKLNVWEALPSRMRQIMEPLLTSCYTCSKRESKCKEHPIFNSVFCRSYEDWAFAWASRLIGFIRNEDTKHLLSSYKPSIKRDNNTLALFFPYILLHAIQESTEEQANQIFEEFDMVFNFGSREVVAPPELDTSGLKEFKSAKYSADCIADVCENSCSDTQQLGASETILRTCTKLCSEQVDFLQRWIGEWRRVNIIGGKLSQKGETFTSIQSFLSRFNKCLIAEANYKTGEYTRALMYLEEYIEGAAEVRLQEQLSFLIKIYGKLMDSDSVEGAVYLKKSNLQLVEEILVNSIVDRPQEAATCYEQLLSKDALINQDHIKGMIDCYLLMDTPETALLITDGLWQRFTDQYTDDYFKECKAELLWRLGRYDELQELLEDSVVRRNITNWSIQCAEAFLLFRQPHDDKVMCSDRFVDQLDVIRKNVVGNMRNCSVVNQSFYPYSYNEVIKLHLLNELEKSKLLVNRIIKYMQQQRNENDIGEYVDEVQEFFNGWDLRANVLRPNVCVMEPVFCFRRNLLLETQHLLCHCDTYNPVLFEKVSDLINKEIGKLWIRSVEMYRESGSLQQAQLSIMKAEKYAPETLFIEKAKLMWQKGDQTCCFKLIEENLDRIEAKCEGDIRKLNDFERLLYAEAKYLQASYNAESMNICSEVNLRYFKEAISGNRSSEKCHVQLAQYLEKIYDSFSEEQKESESGCKLLLDIMLNYAKSLKYGFENVYQSLPRILSIWLDFTSHCSSLVEAGTSDAALLARIGLFQELSRKMNDLINNCINMLPICIFYTAFSQLLSRICHPSMEVYGTLRNIVVKLIEYFPQQSLWTLLPIFKSSHMTRIKRCKMIFTDSRLSKPEFQKLLNDFNMFAERLIELTNKEVSYDCVYELSSLVKQLPKLFKDPSFSHIMLPFEKYLQASFPVKCASLSANLSMKSTGGSDTSSIPTNPFPHEEIYITGVSEKVSVLRSAAKPKKISLFCNDGLEYAVMVKPKDDLRKDFRLMEFNGLVKRYLHQDSQARQRRLRIRTYAAIPLNEECGLVEWLPRLNSFRAICFSIYRMRGLGIPDRMLRQYSLAKSEPIEKKRSVFVDVLLARHPPVFHEWFRYRFPTPHSWYEARSAYVKTIAVMSMVGYILGLGDRHGENILFDETSGDAVHVDFNCLFNQGENFAFPEIVPFRLTHNMVFAMGPLGVEGMFRKSCEITLRLLKRESKTLISVLRPFVYDLVAQSRLKSKLQTSTELTDPKAMLNVRRIEERLQGYVKRTLANSIPLSIEGQVNFLIGEATNIDNLAAMYIGWGSYI